MVTVEAGAVASMRIESNLWEVGQKKGKGKEKGKRTRNFVGLERKKVCCVLGLAGRVWVAGFDGSA